MKFRKHEARNTFEPYIPIGSVGQWCSICVSRFPLSLVIILLERAIQLFKTSSSNTYLRINLSNLPVGCQAFETIRSFGYDSRIDLLSASKFLGFTEVRYLIVLQCLLGFFGIVQKDSHYYVCVFIKPRLKSSLNYGFKLFLLQRSF